MKKDNFNSSSSLEVIKFKKKKSCLLNLVYKDCIYWYFYESEGEKKCPLFCSYCMSALAKAA